MLSWMEIERVGVTVLYITEKTEAEKKSKEFENV